MIGATLVGIATSAIRLVTPYLYASIGETLGQVSGVLNLGLDGIMLMGALAAFVTALRTGSLVLGVVAAAGMGLLFGLITAFVNVTLKAQQGISGIGIYLFGLGMSELLFKKLLGSVQTVVGFPRLRIPWLSDIPYIGEIVFHQNILVYIAFALVPLIAFVLNRTPWGLKVRAVGENPEAADSLGVNVTRTRYLTVCLGGILGGVAGASLSIALVNVFQPNLTNGMGFIAVALVYFGGWKPSRVLLGALLFSTVNALQMWAQVQGIHIPADFTLMIPYVVTIFVFASMRRRNKEVPASLGKPFERAG